MSTWCVVDPNPIWAIVSQPVLATVLVIPSGATHFDGLLPAGSKAFLSTLVKRGRRYKKKLSRLLGRTVKYGDKAQWERPTLKEVGTSDSRKSKVILGQDI